jgi:hypothetical protein
LIFDSELLIEGQPKIEVKLNEKWELYAMLMFYKNIMKESMYVSKVEQVIAEKLHLPENSLNLILMDQFKQLFETNLGPENTKMVFSVISR